MNKIKELSNRIGDYICLTLVWSISKIINED